MTRRTIIIIISLAIVAVLAGGSIFLNSPSPTPSYSEKTWFDHLFPKKSPYDFSNYPESPRLTEFDSNKLNRIENRKEGYSLLKEGDVWKLTAAEVPVNRVKLEQSMISGKLWSISNIWAEQVIEEYPDDISIYGLDQPYGEVLIGDSEGKSIVIILGNLTPSRTSRYIMVAGKPDVYTLSTYSIDNMLFSLDSIRNKNLASYLDPQAITRFTLEPRPDSNFYSRGKIDIAIRDSSHYTVNTFTSFVMNSPFRNVCGVDSEKFGAILEAMQYLQIREYVDDDPATYAPYGLDKPGSVYFETPDGTLDFQFGKSENGAYYAKYPDDPAVFLLDGLDPIVNPDPFALIDKFAMIYNIDNVDNFTVTGDGRTLLATIDGKGDDAIFRLNGRRTADKEFRLFYQAVIGLLIDAEYSGPPNPPRGDGTDWVIQYSLNNPAGITAVIKLIPYNRDFYILERDGSQEFMIARTQARKIFETADKMVYLE